MAFFPDSAALHPGYLLARMECHGIRELGGSPGVVSPDSAPLHPGYLLDTFELARLPPLHSDPFDRMLVCQAIANQMAILTPDPWIAQYPIGVQW